MRIQEQIIWKTLKILIDNNCYFMEYDLDKRLGWKENGTELFAVEEAKGRRIEGVCKHFEMHDEELLASIFGEPEICQWNHNRV